MDHFKHLEGLLFKHLLQQPVFLDRTTSLFGRGEANKDGRPENERRGWSAAPARHPREAGPAIPSLARAG